MNDVELGTGAFCILAGVGLLSGFASLCAFRRWSDAAKLRASFNRIVAHLFEMRLFSDEPALVLRAQRDLIAANGRLLREVSVPSVLLFLPFALLLVGLDAMFARAPLQPGRPAVVTLQYGRRLTDAMPDTQLNAPNGIQVETPPVHVPRMLQISWRIRPIRAVTGELELRCDGRVITKGVSSSPGVQWLADTRAGSLTAFLAHPLELPFSGTQANYISIDYPRANIFNASWIVWFSLAFVTGGLAALVSKRFGILL